MSLNVLQVVPGLDPRNGGVVAAVDGLSKALNQIGVNIEIVTPFRAQADWSLADKLQSKGIKITRIGPVYTPLGWHPKLKSTVDDAVKRADVVHINGIWEEVQHQAARACQRLGKPYIISPHGMLDPWSLKQSPTRKTLYLAWRMRHHLNAATQIHCCSKIESELLEPLKLKPRHFVEANGLDLSEFDPLPEPGRFRNRYPQLKGKRIVLFLSRLHYKKGLDLLIPAFKRANVENTILVLAGPCEAAYQQVLEQTARKVGLDTGRVLFAGMQQGSERIEAFVDAELFVLPSYQENFGIVVAESLAVGTPVLISDQVNIWPEVKEAGVGVVCKTEVASVAETLKAILTAEEPITSADRCRAFVAEQYDWNAIAKRWAASYQQLYSAS